MTFNRKMTPAQLSKVAGALGRLAGSVKYETATGTLTIDKFDPKNEAVIVDTLVENLDNVNEPPDMAELSRKAAQAKRTEAMQARADMARVRAKRQRQAGV
jgi:hypothetical protein